MSAAGTFVFELVDDEPAELPRGSGDCDHFFYPFSPANPNDFRPAVSVRSRAKVPPPN